MLKCFQKVLWVLELVLQAAAPCPLCNRLELGGQLVQPCDAVSLRTAQAAERERAAK